MEGGGGGMVKKIRKREDMRAQPQGIYSTVHVEEGMA